MKVTAIKDKCEGHGQCAVADEELFTLDDDGYVDLGPDGVVVPAGKEDAARRGVAACPAQALVLED